MNCNDSHCHCRPNTSNDSHSFAQFAVQTNPPSNTNLDMTILFQEGEQISLKSLTEILLEPSYIYLINFIFLATPEADSFMQITPMVDGTLRPLYSVFAPTGSASRNTSATGSFTIPVPESFTTISFNLSYPDTVRNIDITGAVSVSALHKLFDNKCC